jgi:hypothetical protein
MRPVATGGFVATLSPPHRPATGRDKGLVLAISSTEEITATVPGVELNFLPMRWQG